MKLRWVSVVVWFLFSALALLLLYALNHDTLFFLLENAGPLAPSRNPLVLFFISTNLNLAIVLILSFLALRAFMRLVIEKRHEVFGSSLKIKLIVSFLFFSLIPSVVLIYLSVRFIEYQNIYKNVFFLLLFSVILLILVFALWVGFTIANELTFPLQVILDATDQVAQGNYHVKVDDVVSDDEIGRLAIRFRDMLSDLCDAQRDAEHATQEARSKADLLFKKSQYNEILLRNTQSCVISFEENGHVLVWNEQAASLFLVSEHDAVGKPIAHLLDQTFYTDCILALVHQLKSARRAIREFVGRVGLYELQLQVSAISLTSVLGRQEIVLFIHDLTEMARAQRHAAWRDVARRIAHEIKNPLTPIQLGAQRLQRKFLERFEPHEQQQFLTTTNIILNSVESIRSLVDEFVQFARMPASVLRWGNIFECIIMVVNSFIDNHEKVPVSLEFCRSHGCDLITLPLHSCYQDVPFHVGTLFDPVQFARLLGNLMTNAISASAEEKTGVRVRVEPDERAKVLRIHVIDSGTGIPAALRERIFEPYFSTKRTGSGLGLVIVKQIVHEHGGVLKFSENFPKGSVFMVEMPLVIREEWDVNRETSDDLKHSPHMRD